MKHIDSRILLLILFLSFSFAGCGSASAPEASITSGSGENRTADSTEDSDTGDSETVPESDTGSETDSGTETADTEANASDTTDENKEGSWDNSVKVLTPTLSQTEVIGNETLSIDISNRNDGYIMTMYTGSASRLKFFIITPDEIRYTYDIYPSESYTTIPLTAGGGSYMIDVREHVEADLYSNFFESPLDITLNNEFLPFLYPNQYSYFTAEDEAVKKASVLASGSTDELSVIEKIYKYVIEHVSYDEEKAQNVQSGYLPDIDETLSSGKGICFDYAALFTAMLRSQGIPTKLEIGYSGEIYHAWISVYSTEHGWISNILEFDGQTWELMDPTLAANNDGSALSAYIGDGNNYTVKYSR